MFVLLHLKRCLIMLLLLGCKIRGRGRAVRTEFGFGFLDLLLGIRELQFGLRTGEAQSAKNKATQHHCGGPGHGSFPEFPFLIHCRLCPDRSSIAVRRMMSPSESPEFTTTSRSFRGPICTVRFSKLPLVS